MIPKDKLLHFGAGLIIALIVTLLSTPLIGVAVGALAGVAKEIYDYFDYGDFDFFDMFVTIIGAVIGSSVVASLIGHYILG